MQTRLMATTARHPGMRKLQSQSKDPQRGQTDLYPRRGTETLAAGS